MTQVMALLFSYEHLMDKRVTKVYSIGNFTRFEQLKALIVPIYFQFLRAKRLLSHLPFDFSKLLPIVF